MMKILKFSLMFTFIICILWGGAVFFGPYIIKKFVEQHFGEEVILYNVAITPKLDVYVSRLDFDFSSSGKFDARVGHIRSLSLTWSLLGSRENLKLNTGSLRTKDNLNFEEFKLVVLDFWPNNFRNARFNISASGVQFFNENHINNAEISGSFNGGLEKLSNLSFSLSTVKSNYYSPFEVDKANGKLDNLGLFSGSINEDFNLQIEARNIRIPHAGLGFNQIQTKISSAGDKIDINLEGLEMSLAGVKGLTDGVARSLKASGQFSKDDVWQNGQLRITLDSFVSNNDKLSLDQVLSDFKFENSSLKISSSAALNAWQVSSEMGYIGSLPQTVITADATVFPREPILEATANFNYEILSKPMINGSGHIELELDSISSVSSCLAATCENLKMNTLYFLEIGGERIKGRADCEGEDCSGGRIYHELETSNTTKLFESLMQTSVLNPVTSAYLYSLFLSGKKIGKGHQLKF